MFKPKINIIKSRKSQTGFTLLEILLVIGVIAILAGIVIVAINPGRQLAQVRNTQRQLNIAEINKALQQYYIDNRSYPPSVTTTLTEICNTGSASSTHNITCTGFTDLSALVPTYLVAIPTDPQATSTTGYEVRKDSRNKIYLNAIQAEFSSVIEIGSRPSVCATQEEGDLVGQACRGTTAVYAGVPGYMTTPNNATSMAWAMEIISNNVQDTANGDSNTSILAGLAGVYPAADYCAGLDFGGYDNWYLPAKDELNTVLYVNRVQLSAGTGVLWSSTEAVNTTRALNQNFGNGDQGSGYKMNSGVFRCIRRY